MILQPQLIFFCAGFDDIHGYKEIPIVKRNDLYSDRIDICHPYICWNVVSWMPDNRLANTWKHSFIKI